MTGTTSLDFLQPGAGNLTIDGLHFHTWQNVLENDNSDAGTTDWLRVTNCEFESVSLYCIDIINELNNALIDGNYFHDLGTGAIKIGDNVYSQQDDWQRITITNNVCKGISNAESGNCHFALVFGLYAKINDNHVEDIQATGGEAWGIYTKVRFGEVCNNTVIGVYSSGSVDTCISVKGDPRGTAGATAEGYALIVSGNMVRGDQTNETVNGIGVFSEDTLVEGNFVEDCTVAVSLTSYSARCMVRGNTLYARANTSGNYGVNANAAGGGR